MRAPSGTPYTNRIHVGLRLVAAGILDIDLTEPAPPVNWPEFPSLDPSFFRLWDATDTPIAVNSAYMATESVLAVACTSGANPTKVFYAGNEPTLTRQAGPFYFPPFYLDLT